MPATRPLLVAAALLLLAALGPAATAQDASTDYGPYPNPYKAPRLWDSPCLTSHSKHFVFDYTGTLTDAWGDAVEGGACEIHRNTSAQFALVLVDNTGGETLENYAFHLFERWGLGDKERHDGLLLLYVKNYDFAGSKSAVRVEAGYGLEGVINSERSYRAVGLMQEAKKEALEGNFTETDAVAYALGTGAYYLLLSLDESYHDGFPPPETGFDGGIDWWFVLRVVIIAIAILSMLVRSSRGRGRRAGWGYTAAPGAWSGTYWGGSGGSWGGGGGGWGGGGFGGGRSGGGGGSGGL